MVGKPSQVVYRHRSGAVHTVDGLRSAQDAGVVWNALSIKEALDAGEDLSRLKLRKVLGPPRPALLSEAPCSQAVASLPFTQLVQQLQRCVDRMRQEAGVKGHKRLFTLLYAAVACQNKEAVLLLLAAAPTLAERRDSRGRTVLHRVASSRSGQSDDQRAACQLAEALLAVPGTATAVDREGRSALYFAMDAARTHKYGFNLALLNMLAAAAPATVALPDAAGRTPVHLAVHVTWYDVTRYLLQPLLDAAPEQVAATVTAAAGLQTPLQLAVEKRNWTPVVQLLHAVMHASRGNGQDGSAAAWQLLQEAANGPAALAQLVGFHGRTLLLAAASLSTAAVLQLLLSEQVGGVMAVDTFGTLPLHKAAEHGCADAVRLLLAAAPAAAMVRDNTHKLPLHYAAMSGNAEVLRLLLEAAPQALTAGGWTNWLPLHAAAYAGNPEAVQVLLDAAPATVGIKTRGGHTALMQALTHKRTDAAKVLLRHGTTQEGLRALRAQAPPSLQRLYAVLVAARLPLSATEWDLVPSPCPKLGRALPAALQHSAQQAQQLVHRLPTADTERLRVAALALSRAQCRLRVRFPGPLVGHILSLVLS